MELDVLYSHIASPPVVANFAALAQRIANKELPHGADIIVGIHARLLKESYPLPFKPAPPNSLLNNWGRSGLVKMDVNASDVSDAEAADETGPSHVEKPRIRLTPFPYPPESGAAVSVPRPSPQPTATASLQNFPSSTEPKARVNKKGSKQGSLKNPLRNGVSPPAPPGWNRPIGEGTVPQEAGSPPSPELRETSKPSSIIFRESYFSDSCPFGTQLRRTFPNEAELVRVRIVMYVPGVSSS